MMDALNAAMARRRSVISVQAEGLAKAADKSDSDDEEEDWS